MNLSEKVQRAVRNIPDFPEPGIQFKDITPVLGDPALVREILDHWVGIYGRANLNAVAGVESRGFLFGTALAERLQVPFIPVRKKGKLPYKTVSYKYDLEYGSAEMEMHEDALHPGDRVLIHDDLLATGGTAAAAARLCKMRDAEVFGFCFLIELAKLGGRRRPELQKHPVDSLAIYE